MADTQGLAAKMKVLSDAYIAQLPAKLAQLEQAWQQLPHNAWDEQEFRTVCRMVHSLSGSGTTFGLPALSESARELEAYLEQLGQQKAVPSVEQVEYVKHAIAGFYRVVSAHGAA